MFDTLLDPWQLACAVLIIAVVLAAGRWHAVQLDSREVEQSASEAETQA